jgi:hydroxymethylpyrimidine/phosphomethylpyrimidine kinase
VKPVVLSIGCSDPWNAAGTGLDIRALFDCGVRPVTALAGVTAQDAAGLRAARAVAPELLAAQFDALADADVRAIRIGALLDAATVEVVAARVRASRLPAVYDPVFGPSGGGSFVTAEVVAAITRDLVPAVAVVTPNLDEAGKLTGSTAPIDAAAMERAARALVASGAGAALVKGGHLPAGALFDVLVDRDGRVVYEAPRIEGTVRGSGCLLACGIAAGLARGATLRDAIESSRAFVRERFANAVIVGGMRLAY